MGPLPKVSRYSSHALASALAPKGSPSPRLPCFSSTSLNWARADVGTARGSSRTKQRIRFKVGLRGIDEREAERKPRPMARPESRRHVFYGLNHLFKLTVTLTKVIWANDRTLHVLEQDK